MWLGTKLFGSKFGLRNVAVELMLTVGTENLEKIWRRGMKEFRKSNVQSVLVEV